MIGLFILRIPGGCCKWGARRCDSRVDHGMVMRARYKTGLVRRGGQINAVIQHGVEKGFEARHIAAGNLTEAGGRAGAKYRPNNPPRPSAENTMSASRAAWTMPEIKRSVCAESFS